MSWHNIATDWKWNTTWHYRFSEIKVIRVDVTLTYLLLLPKHHSQLCYGICSFLYCMSSRTLWGVYSTNYGDFNVVQIIYNANYLKI